MPLKNNKLVRPNRVLLSQISSCPDRNPTWNVQHIIVVLMHVAPGPVSIAAGASWVFGGARKSADTPLPQLSDFANKIARWELIFRTATIRARRADSRRQSRMQHRYPLPAIHFFVAMRHLLGLTIGSKKRCKRAVPAAIACD